MTDLVNPLPVLVVSSRQEDHVLFEVFLSGTGYALHHALTLAEALTALERHPVRVIVTERTLTDGSWVDVHPPLGSALEPPLVIVFSDPEDAASWAHAFNVGAFDVLSRPLVEKIVEGSVTLANLRWSRSAERHSARAENPLATPLPRKLSGKEKAKTRSTAA